MCAKFSWALLLALLLPVPLSSDGGYFMDQASKDESLRILNELELTLSEHKRLLLEAIENATRLDERLTSALSSLEKSEQSLQEAKQRLADSEASSARVSEQLTKALKALDDSERSFKAYRRSEVLRIVGASIVSFVLGLLTGFGLSMVF